MKREKYTGYFGEYGGRYVPEILIPALDELNAMFIKIAEDNEFYNDYYSLLTNFSGRPTPLTYAKNLTEYFGKGKIYIKREDLNHSGAHKINNVLGQGLVMKRLGKTRAIAETGAGQHGVATAIMAAKMGFKATIYMGEEDVKRQYSNVFWMKQLGAEVIPVETGAATLKDAINEALRDWATNFDTTHYVLGTACGPKPFPEMVTHFQSVIGREIKEQIMTLEGKAPDRIYACLGGGSNAMGAFNEFLEDKNVGLIAVEAGGKGSNTDLHASRIAYGKGRVGVSQGYKTLFLQDDDGQMKDTWSISAGLDYVGVSPIVAHLSDINRVRALAATDNEVIDAFKLVVSKEGIIPALESTHAFAGLFSEIKNTKSEDILIVNMSGRGDKDIFNVGEALEDSDWKKFVIERGEQYAD
ncbi:tryptophan synthase subunit beta [Alkaliphilus peptidifermentans]|uniref:Tryptophan synthase beta chain n=1 Tax=Alkaliphilus peptidifermentans DSM 18978 TaxID=1120976 RepID=A0A1G5JRQ3_9FIRM|nr:tryptophan synthase subunit beta [Alkaliphilus peptidifermentans]SCY90418.1 tryptophan synthase beta chain [Alkaliphilus peptidifermentans DSM 18978]